MKPGKKNKVEYKKGQKPQSKLLHLLVTNNVTIIVEKSVGPSFANAIVGITAHDYFSEKT